MARNAKKLRYQASVDDVLDIAINFKTSDAMHYFSSFKKGNDYHVLHAEDVEENLRNLITAFGLGENEDFIMWNRNRIYDLLVECDLMSNSLDGKGIYDVFQRFDKWCGNTRVYKFHYMYLKKVYEFKDLSVWREVLGQVDSDTGVLDEDAYAYALKVWENVKMDEEDLEFFYNEYPCFKPDEEEETEEEYLRCAKDVDIEGMEQAIKDGVTDINAVDEDGNNAYMIGADLNDIQLMQQAKKDGVNIHVVNNNLANAIEIAFKQQNWEAVTQAKDDGVLDLKGDCDEE